MKKVLTKICLFVLGVLLVLTPFGIFFLVANSQPHIYSKTYYAALVDKVQRLDSLKNEKKIILIGGSNVAFGFNSQLIEEEFPEYKVVNFGLYAMLGTKIMMDLALSSVNEGDMVFISPEINPQSTSLYFDPTSTLKAIEDNMDIMNRLPKDNKNSVIGSYFDFVVSKSKLDQAIDPGETVYRRNNFNEYGDVQYASRDSNGVLFQDRNRMPVHYDPGMIIDYSYSIDRSFTNYINNFGSFVKKKKAKLFYAFSPVNELAIKDKTEAPIEYYWALRQSLSCDVIGNPIEYIIDPHYFYDSNFHLNNSGAIFRTLLFINDIKRDVLKLSKIESYDVSPKPDYPEQDTYIDNGFSDYYDYESVNDDYAIVSVKNDYRNLVTLTTPTIYNERPVRIVSRNAFDGCYNVESIIITDNIAVIENGSFNGTPHLNAIYLTQLHPSDIIVDYQKGLFEDNKDVFIYVPASALSEYQADYNWSNYSELLKGY